MLKGVPLEPGYENTLYFTSELQQYRYFFNHDGYSFDRITYTRYNRNVVRVQKNIKYLYDANYLMYSNGGGGAPGAGSQIKWFYCFVKEINYINENVTEIVFEPDVIQSWLFAYDLGKCFVERQHTETDAIGEWLEQEDIETGPYVYDSYADFDVLGVPVFSSWDVVIAATFDVAVWDVHQEGGVITSIGVTSWDDEADGDIYGGVYSGLKFRSFHIVDVQNNQAVVDETNLMYLNAFIREATAATKSDGIVSIFMVPSAFTTGLISETTPYVQQFTFDKKIPISNNTYRWYFTADSAGTPSATYPKNNKLYTYPYTSLLVTDQQGNSQEYRYEFLNGGAGVSTFVMELQGLTLPNVECQLVPIRYKGVAKNYAEKMTLANFPQCAYVIDSYKAWLAQQGGALGVGLDIAGIALPAIIGTASGVARAGAAETTRQSIGASSGIASSLSNAALQAGNLVRTHLVEQARPPRINGQQANSIGVATRSIGFKLYNARITETYAKIIDDYFTKYGYSLKRMMVPNNHARPYWTYTKTVGLNYTRCDMPGDIAEQITSIYNNGITWWRANFTLDSGGFTDYTNVGDYTMDNRPVSQ